MITPAEASPSAPPSAHDIRRHGPARRCWRSEVRNALLGIVRAGQLDFSDAIASMTRAERLLIGSSHEVDSAHVLELAMSSACSAHDCEYVSLAETLDVRLVTSDREILAAFPERAVDLRAYAAGN